MPSERAPHDASTTPRGTQRVWGWFRGGRRSLTVPLGVALMIYASLRSGQAQAAWSALLWATVAMVGGAVWITELCLRSTLRLRPFRPADGPPVPSHVPGGRPVRVVRR